MNHPASTSTRTKLAAVVGLEQGWSRIYDQALVAVAQKQLDPGEVAQPFLSPPTVAWLAAVLVPVPYTPSYYIWAVLTLAAYAGALVWSISSRGLDRWILVAAAIAPWWVLEAFRVGQVVPLVAASLAVSWRLLREDRNVAAGFVLSLLLLKPNTAFVVPLAVLAAGRFRTFATLSAVGAALAVVALVTVGGEGAFDYWSQLTGSLPTGANALTLESALGVRGPAITALRIVIIVVVLRCRFQASPHARACAGGRHPWFLDRGSVPACIRPLPARGCRRDRVGGAAGPGLACTCGGGLAADQSLSDRDEARPAAAEVATRRARLSGWHLRNCVACRLLPARR